MHRATMSWLGPLASPKVLGRPPDSVTSRGRRAKVTIFFRESLEGQAAFLLEKFRGPSSQRIGLVWQLGEVEALVVHEADEAHNDLTGIRDLAQL